MKTFLKILFFGATFLALAVTNVLAVANANGQGGFKGNADNAREIGNGHQYYYSFGVDTSNDIFVNPRVFQNATGLNFIDENGDGICDIAQDSELFSDLKVGKFEDKNSDGIHDEFQTHEFYQHSKMDNYVDVDGDGICDNYEESPIVN